METENPPEKRKQIEKEKRKEDAFDLAPIAFAPPRSPPPDRFRLQRFPHFLPSFLPLSMSECCTVASLRCLLVWLRKEEEEESHSRRSLVVSFVVRML